MDSVVLLGACTGELLAEFLTDDFADVTDALALVWLRLAKLADLGGELTDGLLVCALNVDLRALGFNLHGQAFFDLNLELVGETEGQDDGLALEFGLVTDALDFEVLHVAFRDALEIVGDQGAGE